MALQKKIIDCGLNLTAFAMLLRFVVAPTMIAVSSLAVGLRGDVLCMAIMQIKNCTSYTKTTHTNTTSTSNIQVVSLNLHDFQRRVHALIRNHARNSPTGSYKKKK
ncbi:Auxin efflux carrier [Cynara cardunculus var. scolymus]|uniref:Auxin efflux carrier n=1 Tax=Cynara cardunculus var. scolymus TaxID=59895 RepID=A0A103XLL7_CYNCS|nr:Auxin efflux carrier [Cynara cardunculus var. scolymus]